MLIAILILFLILGLPTLLILTPLVRRLWLVRNGRAWEELLLSAGVLTAPCLMLLAFDLARPSDPGWLILGLAIGVPLWGMMKLLLRVFRCSDRAHQPDRPPTLGRRRGMGQAAGGRYRLCPTSRRRLPVLHASTSDCQFLSRAQPTMTPPAGPPAWTRRGTGVTR
jgi:hypothetical protein